MRAAKCPECGASVRVSSAADVGDEITCASCGEELEVVDGEPLTLGYLGDYEEQEDDDFEDEEEEDEEEEEWDDLSEGEDDSF